MINTHCRFGEGRRKGVLRWLKTVRKGFLKVAAELCPLRTVNTTPGRSRRWTRTHGVVREV